MKSFGKVDSAWDMDRFRNTLGDASEMSKEHDASFYIGEDRDENLVVVPKAERDKVHIFACGVSTGARFWDNVAFENYAIGDMVPRVRGCLMRGIIEYGNLGFLSEGRIQLAGALSDAKKLAKKHSAPFIIGLTKQQRGIMVAPISEKAKFVDPLAAIVTAHGSWGVSDMRSRRFGRPPHIVGTPEDIEIFEGLDDSGLVFMLYEGVAYGKKQCGRFEAGDRRCIDVLEGAIEDGAKMAQAFGDERGYMVMVGGAICVERRWDSPGGAGVGIRPQDFLDGEALMRDKVSDAAKAAYEKFSRAVESRRDAGES